MRFDITIQQIEEALSFRDTFKVPGSEELEVRRLELIADIIKYLDKTELLDGTWEVDGGLNLSGEKLRSFKGLNISRINGWFSCTSCGLTSLEYGPAFVTGSYNCSWNPIKNFIGAPKSIGDSFSFSQCEITSLEGFPKEILGHVYGEETPLRLTEDMIRAVCKVGGRIYV